MTTPTARRPRPSGPPSRAGRACPRIAVALATAALVAGCAGADPGTAGAGATGTPSAAATDWATVQAQARGKQVDLWMYGGDQQGNAYVDTVLAPAARAEGVTIRRVPVTDTADVLNRVLSEQRAGRTGDGSVDLVWVNGENFRTGKQAGAWRCGWSSTLPNTKYTDPADPLLTSDFGTPVDGCEAPWHKAQFVFAYDSAKVPDPPTTVAGLLDWAKAHPGRFTYPAPPDFTGSAFVRQALYSVAGGPASLPTAYSKSSYDAATPALWKRLSDLAPSLWRQGSTYPRDLPQLEKLYADGQVDITMTYGPATLDALVRKGTFPATTRVLDLADGTLGNASFLGIPANAADPSAAMVVANLALSPEQQLAKAKPDVWGQYTVLAQDRLPADVRAGFAALPSSPVVPPFAELSRDAAPELAAAWVTPLDRDWRARVLGAG